MFVAGRLKNVLQFGLAGEPKKGTFRARLQPSLQEQLGVGQPCPRGRASFSQWRRQGVGPASSSFGVGGNVARDKPRLCSVFIPQFIVCGLRGLLPCFPHL